jgi:hypothetical protein
MPVSPTCGSSSRGFAYHGVSSSRCAALGARKSPCKDFVPAKIQQESLAALFIEKPGRLGGIDTRASVIVLKQEEQNGSREYGQRA